LLQQERKKANQAIILLLPSMQPSRVDGRHPILNRLIEVLMNMPGFIILTKIREFMDLNMFHLQKLKI
jgi:hypothetical protein